MCIRDSLVQNSRLAEADDIATASYDGIPQVWFDTLEDAIGLQSDPAYAAADDDQVHFMDRTKLKFLMLGERAIDGDVGPGDGHGVNLLLLVRRRQGATQEQFDSEWIGADDRGWGQALGATRHVTSRSLPESYAEEEPAYDGLRELFFTDLASLRAARERAPEAWEGLTHPPAADPGQSVIYVATQRRMR